MRITYFLLIIISLLSVCYSQSCDDKVIKVGSKKFDLSSLKGQEIEFSNINYVFRFSICSNIKEQCGFEKCTTEFGGCRSENEFDEYCLGKHTDDDKFEIINEGKGLAITYESGDRYDDGCWITKDRNLRIEILCDKNIKGIPTKIEAIEPTCDPLITYYTFRFSHMAGCPLSSGLSPGSIMLIILFVSIAVYIIGGIIINAVIRKKTGVEMIPNSSFWMGFPSLIKDGFFFLIGRRSNEVYETIE